MVNIQRTEGLAPPAPPEKPHGRWHRAHPIATRAAAWPKGGTVPPAGGKFRQGYGGGTVPPAGGKFRQGYGGGTVPPAGGRAPQAPLFPAPCSLLPAPYSLLPTPCSLLPAPWGQSGPAYRTRRVFPARGFARTAKPWPNFSQTRRSLGEGGLLPPFLIRPGLREGMFSPERRRKHQYPCYITPIYARLALFPLREERGP